MSRQNRVTPYGEIVAVSAKGTLMGNRRCLTASSRLRSSLFGQMPHSFDSRLWNSRAGNSNIQPGLLACLHRSLIQTVPSFRDRFIP